MTSACASRTPPATGVPSPQPASKPPDVPTPPPQVVEPVPAPVVTPTPRPEPASSECALVSEPGEPITTVALGESVNPANAPHPSNDSERLVFRQLYETLVRVDCKGRVVPGLAASWRLSIDGLTWIVRLRPDARFSDGSSVSAAAVVALWSRDGVGGDLRPHVNRLVQSIIAVDNETLAILLRSPRVDVPFALAHTDLAIAQPAGASWPLGTRSAQATTDRAGTTITTADGVSVRFLAPGRDARDVLDRAVDLLITRDRSALDYAATLPQFQSVALEWQRTEALLSPVRSPATAALSAARGTLASDAVRGEARGAMGPFWWQNMPDCEMAPPRAQEAGWRPSNRVVYDASDGTARDLAERLVGLGRYQRAIAMSGGALAVARRRGGDAAYIMSFDSRPLDPCHELQAVMERTPWLDPESIVPLVETRQRAIVRRGRSGILSEWDGGLLISGGSDQR